MRTIVYISRKFASLTAPMGRGLRPGDRSIAGLGFEL